MSFQPVVEIKVGLDFGQGTKATPSILRVGRLAFRDGIVYFEYADGFLARRLDISPLHLALRPGVHRFDRHLFEGLPGVFNDSLPDGWGRLLLDRALRGQGIQPGQLSVLDRLSHVGCTGMGALVYEPVYSIETYTTDFPVDLSRWASDALDVLEGDADAVLHELLQLNGSSAGARPKAMIGVDAERRQVIHGMQVLPQSYQPWMVKFPNTQDGLDAGAIEYVYAKMACDAGIEMAQTHLFPATKSAGYFATARFDRNGSRRVHMHTACGLLHSDFRTPALDYEDLLALTHMLTRDVREVEKMFRWAAFNVLAHNRDDHAKNFSFLMNAKGEWKLSPAYDLTFSVGPGGQQSTMVMGEGKHPNKAHLIKLGRAAQLDASWIASILEQTDDAISHWHTLAKTYGVSRDIIKLIGQQIVKRNSGFKDE